VWRVQEEGVKPMPIDRECLRDIVEVVLGEEAGPAVGFVGFDFRKLVEAIVSVESGGETWAGRYEPRYPYVSGLERRPKGCSVDTEEFFQCCSWGLMQVMGATARGLGLEGWIPQLTIPGVGVRYGVKYLVQQGKRYSWDMEKMIASYNAGSAVRSLDRPMEWKNELYVNKVLFAMDSVSA